MTDRKEPFETFNGSDYRERASMRLTQTAEVNWCDCCKTEIKQWNEVACFIPQPDRGHGPHPRPKSWGKVHQRAFRENDGTCSKCEEPGFPYCTRHDAP